MNNTVIESITPCNTENYIQFVYNKTCLFFFVNQNFIPGVERLCGRLRTRGHKMAENLRTSFMDVLKYDPTSALHLNAISDIRGLLNTNKFE